MSETLFGFTLVLMLLAAVAAVRAEGGGRKAEGDEGTPSALRRWLLVGLALGAAVLTRPVAQAMIPLVALAALLAGGRDWRRGLLRVAALGLGLALLQGTWVARNAFVTGNPSASTFGRTLIARTAYYDRGFVFDVPGQPHADPRVQRAREIVQEGSRREESDGVIAGRLRAELDLNPVQVNQVMRDLAVAAILRDPGHYVAGTLAFAWEIFVGLEERLRDHWDEYKDANPWDERIRGLVGGPTAAELEERSNANKLANIYQPVRFYQLLAALFVIGTLLALVVPRYRRALLPAGAVALLLLLSAALNGPVERYRYPLDPLIAVVTAGGLVGALALALSASRRALAAATGGRTRARERGAEPEAAIPSPLGRGLG